MDPIRVLLVEHDSGFRQLAARFLDRCVDTVVASCDNTEGVSLAGRWRPHVAVVGIGTSDLDGLATISKLRAIMPEVGVVAMSLFGDTGYRKAALAAGAHDFVPKAALATELRAAIQGVWEHHVARRIIPPRPDIARGDGRGGAR